MQMPDVEEKKAPETSRLLKLVSSQDHPVESEHVEHLDERWLVSYADMMTLLFGLFVMLFSIASRHHGDFEQRLSAIAQSKFGAQEKTDESKPTATAVPSILPVVVPSTSDAVAELKKSMSAELEKRVSEARDEQRAIVEKEFGDKIQKIQSLLKRKEEEIKNLQEARTPSSVPTDTSQLAALAQTKAELQTALDQAQSDLEKSNAETAQTKDQLDKLKTETKSIVPFMMVMIQWSTADHDVDLTVQDPSGKVFDFKHRQFPNHPGIFSLDSTHGPGAEIWEAHEVVPGDYKIKYYFYSQYGNKQNVIVKGKSLSQKGSVEFPPVELDFDKNRTATFTMRVAADGKIVLIK